MRYKNLTIIGTSHIAKQSVLEVTKEIEDKKPDIVALELDYDRLQALLYNKKSKIRFRDMFRIGIKGYLFSILGQWAEKKMGSYVGMSPGADMLTAAKMAQKHNIGIALIDQHISITLKRFSRALTWKEKWNFLVDIFEGLILRKKQFEFDLSTVPEKRIIKKLLRLTKKRYPNIYRVLVTERNQFMAKKLVALMKNDEDKQILAIVGAGHEEDILEIIKKKHNLTDYSYSYTVIPDLEKPKI